MFGHMFLGKITVLKSSSIDYLFVFIDINNNTNNNDEHLLQQKTNTDNTFKQNKLYLFFFLKYIYTPEGIPKSPRSDPKRSRRDLKRSRSHPPLKPHPETCTP